MYPTTVDAVCWLFASCLLQARSSGLAQQAYLAFPVGDQLGFSCPVLLIPAQSFQAPPQIHQTGIDGNTLPASSCTT